MKLLKSNSGLQYGSFGNKDDKTLLFLHGFGSHLENYSLLLDSLSRKYYVLAPLLFGIHDSLENQPIEWNDYLNTTLNFCREHVPENAYLVGHSYGALMAMILSQDIKAQKVVAMNALVPGKLNTKRVAHMASTLIKDLFNPIGEINSIQKWPSIPGAYLANIIKNPLAYVTAGFSANQVEIDNIESSTDLTIIHSDEDAMFSTGQVVDMKKKFSNSKMKIIPGLSHNWAIYYPHMASKVILDSLEN